MKINNKITKQKNKKSNLKTKEMILNKIIIGNPIIFVSFLFV